MIDSILKKAYDQIREIAQKYKIEIPSVADSHHTQFGGSRYTGPYAETDGIAEDLKQKIREVKHEEENIKRINEELLKVRRYY